MRPDGTSVREPSEPSTLSKSFAGSGSSRNEHGREPRGAPVAKAVRGGGAWGNQGFPHAKTAPRLADIEAARERLDGVARVTPVYGSETLSRRTGRDVWLKAENLQRTGSFKIRGAYNKISTLGEAARAAGVVAASAGNHGQAVAWAAHEVGVPATVFVPQDAPMAKVEATRNYGARVEMTGARFEDALDAAQGYVEECGAVFVHPFEDEVVIAGQGTIGLELAEQLPDAETVVVPIGGGGLCAGIALALKSRRPRTRILGVQAAGCLPG